HAFPGGRSGEIRVEVRSVAEDLEVEVTDTGVGFPEGLELTKVTTLGMQLVVLLTKQLRGSLELRRDHGTTFRVRFPAPPPVDKPPKFNGAAPPGACPPSATGRRWPRP